MDANPDTAEWHCPACGWQTCSAQDQAVTQDPPPAGRNRRSPIAALIPFGVVAVLAVMGWLLAQSTSSVPLVRQAREVVFGRHLSSAADQALQLARTLTSANPRGAEPSPSEPASQDSPPAPVAPDDNRRQPVEPEPTAPPPAPAESLPRMEPQPPARPPTPTPPAAVPRPAIPPQARAPVGRRPVPAGRVRSSGSAFFITDDGYLLTSRHVVASANRVVIRTKRGDFPAQVIQSNSDYDIALLKASGTFRALPLANSQNVRLGDGVFTIGFPSPGIQGVEPKFTRGEINSLAGIQDDPRFFQMSVAIQPGNSGGPLVTPAGNIVGLIAMRLNDMNVLEAVGSLPQNVNYAVKSSCILTFLRALPAVAGKLKPVQTTGIRRSEDVVKEVEEAVGLVLVY